MLQDDSTNKKFPGSGAQKFELKKSTDTNVLNNSGMANNFSAPQPNSSWFKQFLTGNTPGYGLENLAPFQFQKPGVITTGSISISKHDEAGFNMLRSRGLRNLSAGNDSQSKPANPFFKEGDINQNPADEENRPK